MNKEGTLNKPHFLNKEILKYRKPNSLLEQREFLISPTKFTSSTSTLLLNILHSKLVTISLPILFTATVHFLLSHYT